MNYFLLCFVAFTLLLPLHGQNAGSALDLPAPPGATVITSDELQMDQLGHTAVFTGNVLVTGTNFKMSCEGMTVYFTNGNRIDNIVAKGSVVINQPGRITHCGQAQYFHTEDKFVLTDQPDILDNKNEISAPEITIFRTEKKLITKGRTKTVIIEGAGASATSIEPAGGAK